MYMHACTGCLQSSICQIANDNSCGCTYIDSVCWPTNVLQQEKEKLSLSLSHTLNYTHLEVHKVLIVWYLCVCVC